EYYRSALQSGLLKGLSAVGISTVSAYRGSARFEVIGLDAEIADLAFRNRPRRTGGLGVEDVAERVRQRAAHAQDGAEVAGGVCAEVADLAFRNAPRRTGGLGCEDLAERVLQLHAGYEDGEEFPGGFYKQRRGGTYHVTSPATVLALQRAVRSGEQADWDAYL